jgi:hypothetical protein
MQLELLNEQGQAASKYDAPETVFGREYNEDLVHQIVVAPGQRPPGHARPEGPPAGQSLDQEAVQAKGHGPRPRRYDFLAAVARRRPDFPEHA